METKITKLETKLINIESKLDLVLKELTKEKQTKRTIVKKSSQKSKKTSPQTKKTSTPVINSDRIIITEYSDNIILVTGDTYECRHLLKPYRAKWEPEKKGWSIYIKNINNYSSFKNQLETSCKKFTMKSMKSSFKTPSSSKFTNEGSPQSSSNICQIESSSDED